MSPPSESSRGSFTCYQKIDKRPLIEKLRWKGIGGNLLELESQIDCTPREKMFLIHKSIIAVSLKKCLMRNGLINLGTVENLNNKKVSYFNYFEPTLDKTVIIVFIRPVIHFRPQSLLRNAVISNCAEFFRLNCLTISSSNCDSTKTYINSLERQRSNCIVLGKVK